jgi:hypothetical protein
MGVPLVLRWVWWRMNAAAELLAIVASSLAAPWLLATALPEGGRLLVMAALTTAVSVVVAAAGSRTPSPAALTFYERVGPPGFWAPVAARCGDEPGRPLRRLVEGLWLAAAAALAVFCLLVAACTWLFESPPPAWCPWRGPWIAACLALAAALVAALRRGLPPVLDRSVRAEPPTAGR